MRIADGLMAAWSPDGTRIAVMEKPKGSDTNDEIYVMNADGTNQVNLTNSPTVDWGPSW